MGEIGITDRLFGSVPSAVIADLERIKKLGLSEEAEKELADLLARLSSDIEA